MKIHQWCRTAVAGVLAFGLSAASASAGPLLDGPFTIVSLFRPADGQTGEATSLDDATGIDFLNVFGPQGSTGQFVIGLGTGDFASVPGNRRAIRDFSFGGPGGALPTAPLSGFESLRLAGLTFDLNDIRVLNHRAYMIHMTGNGVFNRASAGYDPTAGMFDLHGSANGLNLAFNLDEGTSPNPVPEPGSMALLASGIAAGCARYRRRQRQMAA